MLYNHHAVVVTLGQSQIIFTAEIILRKKLVSPIHTSELFTRVPLTLFQG